MLFLHQVHALRSGHGDAFEARWRDEWLPGIAGIDGARLAWVARPTPASRFADEAVTVVALRDAAALDGFARAVRDGELRGLTGDLAEHRTGVQTRLLGPIDYDPWAVALDDIPITPQDGAGVMYMHDFVPPVTGQMQAYVDMMRARYMALSEQALSSVVLRASWQTLGGGGPMPEMFNLSEIRDPDALVNLLAYEIPREHKEMGTWMWDALATRDRWTTRLLRSVSWSPVQ